MWNTIQTVLQKKLKTNSEIRRYPILNFPAVYQINTEYTHV